MSRDKDKGVSTRPPRKWGYFLVGLGAAAVVSAGLWLGKGQGQLRRARKSKVGLKQRLEQCRTDVDKAAHEADHDQHRYRRLKRRYIRLKRLVNRMISPETIKARDALRALAATGRAWGYINPQGKVVIAGRYVAAGPFSAGLAAVVVHGKRGYVNLQGNVVIRPRFEEADPFWVLASATKPEVIPGALRGALPGGRPAKAMALARVRVGGQYGVIDQRGRFVVKPGCTWVSLHPSGLIQCQRRRKGQKLSKKRRTKRRRSRRFTAALYRADGRLMVHGRMHRLKRFANRRLAVKKGKHWGFVNARGNWVIPPTYKRVRGFQGGAARVRTKSGWGFVDPKGKLLGRSDWLVARDFSGGRAAVSAPRGWGFIDRTGKVVVPTRLEDVHDFAKGLAPVKKLGRWGFIDGQGRWIVKPRYVDAKPFVGGLSVVDEAKRFYHCITTRGTVAGRPGPPTPDSTAPKPFEVSGKWGYRDAAGQVIVAPRFQWADRFFDRRARVRVAGKWGYVDPTGKVVIAAKYGRAHVFSEGLAAVWVGTSGDGAYALIDRDAKVVVSARYHWVGRFRGGFALASIHGSDALIDRQGKVHLLASGGSGCTPVRDPQDIGFSGDAVFVDAWERPVPKPQPLKKPTRRQRRRQMQMLHEPLAADDTNAALTPRLKDGRYGFVDRGGVWRIPPTFERAGPFRQGRAAVLLGRLK